MHCGNCGNENKEDSQFCQSCGQTLGSVPQQTSQGYQPQMAQPNYFQPTEYQVQQKLLSMTQTYKIKDANGIEFMVARRKMTSIFNPKIEVKDMLGNDIGYVQGNFFRTRWEVYDSNENHHGTIEFPFFMFFTKSFTITTPIGMFRSGGSVFGKRFDAYAPDGRLSFVVDKKLFSIRDSFKVTSNDQLGPFLTCIAAVVIDQKFNTGNE